MSDETQRKTVWVAYTNSDLTEGRGYDIPIAVCELEETAVRYARGKYVQGSDGPVRPMETLLINGKLHIPLAAVNVIPPSEADRRREASLAAMRAAIAKAKALGLSAEDILALRFA